jgi:hypothetical protein
VYGDIFKELHNLDYRDSPDTAPRNIPLGNPDSSDRDVSAQFITTFSGNSHLIL